ncbi:MAG: hypothetical protein KAJ18_03880 [Candidatus Omnitrophica bacterium]|nr:hypothetical protein [Candidatus Omnitrophota bacterium]
MAKKKQVVLGVTGSIAAYKAADIIRRLQDKDFSVSVIMTKASQEFITPLTLESLSGSRVYHEMFHGKNEAWEGGHIDLAQQADVLLIAPATANMIGKIACGLADDLLSCTAMTTRAPVLIAPAMNEAMYTNTAVQSNCQKLKEFGMTIIEPVEGKLACGVVGKGKLAEVDDIVQAVVNAAG